MYVIYGKHIWQQFQFQFHFHFAICAWTVYGAALALRFNLSLSQYFDFVGFSSGCFSSYAKTHTESAYTKSVARSTNRPIFDFNYFISKSKILRPCRFEWVAIKNLNLIGNFIYLFCRITRNIIKTKLYRYKTKWFREKNVINIWFTLREYNANFIKMYTKVIKTLNTQKLYRTMINWYWKWSEKKNIKND